MKKILALFLVLVMAISLSACSTIVDVLRNIEIPTPSTTGNANDRVHDEVADTEDIYYPVDGTDAEDTYWDSEDWDAKVEEQPTTDTADEAVDAALYNIPALPVSVTELTPATIQSVSGNIYVDKQEDLYTYTPVRDGRYTFQFSEVRAEITLSLSISDRLGSLVANNSYADNGDYLAVDLVAGETYTVRVAENSGFGSYILNIGEQTETVDVSSYSAVNDSVKFVKQKNVYTFVPEIDGRYTFQLSEVRNGITLQLSIFDRLGNTVANNAYADNGDYLDVDLIAGDTYTVYVGQSSDLGSYILNIGKQKETVDNIAINSIVNDSVEFRKQINVYTFTAKNSTHTLSFSGMMSDLTISVYVLNHLDEIVGSNAYLDNGDTINLNNLTPGKEYKIKIHQSSNFGDYTFSIE